MNFYLYHVCSFEVLLKETWQLTNYVYNKLLISMNTMLDQLQVLETWWENYTNQDYNRISYTTSMSTTKLDTRVYEQEILTAWQRVHVRMT